ncbi:PAH-inducible cytochrome P450 monooxygenase PC-PAH 4 [Epithele typhae]|uniref:PAH-inducible cytochrome P450 monooxygenase PC-PAH 4 n=1 Tax=Epithele typhae TaxID=378194 RepID=UPI0020088780|nr:PAH-inducible cytochrome P450 monooxygenase PC-PAH 4 [Epithele typhae]KAH9935130.1 PAH-inducible cytochrome P450 monooxygenase PC-PAH 4 [Epithele typhae]
MEPIYAYALCGAAVAVAVLTRIRRRRSLRNIRGPSSPSWLFGNEYELFHQAETGDLDFAWMREYGPTWRTHGYFGAEQVMTTDPKALAHIYKAGYNYYKRVDLNHMTYLMLGPGVLWAEGEKHHRHRKVMNPAFAPAQIRAFVPLFQRTAQKLAQRWRAEIARAPGKPLLVNEWLARGSLDIIGEAAFDYDFGALDGQENPLGKEINAVIGESLLAPSKGILAVWALFTLLPERILLLTKHTPAAAFARFRRLNASFAAIGRPIYREGVAADAWESGDRTARRDVLSVLVKANRTERASTRLGEDEVLAQMHNLTAAAQETTATTLSWMFWELAKRPAVQAAIRREVRDARGGARPDGFTVEELEGMRLLGPRSRCETLRYHPTAFHLWRVAAVADVIPLSEPVVGADGQWIHEIPISAGTGVHISVCGYHRLKSAWGDDAHEWNPDRWFTLDPAKQVKIGIYENLMSFSSGPHACIGWKFGLYQIQAVAAEFLEQFEFALPLDKPHIRRTPAAIMMPMVDGKPELGAAMPLRVSVAA